MRRFNQKLWLMLLIAAMALAACSSTPATTAPVATNAPASTAVPTATTAPTAVPTKTPTLTPAPTKTPTPTPVPTNTPAPLTGAACLVGTWESVDLSVYMQSVIAKSGGDVKFIGQTGRIVYAFGADGKARVVAQDFTMKLAMAVQMLTFDINVTISGAANSQYTATADKITYSNGEMKDLKVSAKMNGTELFSSTPDELAAMFGASADPRYNSVAYQCDGTTLVYTPPIADAQPVIMKRVQ